MSPRNLLSALLSLMTIAVAPQPTAASLERIYRVAITQIVEHGALDDERHAFLSTLEAAGYVEGRNLRVRYDNAQGNIITATQIAKSIVADRPDGILAISTPSAQAVLAAAGKKGPPIVFTAVTDPVGARLANSPTSPKMGITGVSDAVPIEPQLGFIRTLLPRVKTIGVIYNAGEANSVVQVDALKKTAALQNIQIIATSVARPSDISSATESLVGRVDAVYLPTDNMIVSAVDSIVRVGIKRQLPIIAADFGSVRRGAIAAVGYDRAELGKAAGLQMIKILSGTPPDQIPIRVNHPIEILINAEAAKKMGVALPTPLPTGARLVGGAS